jgi:hypothetical protein
VPQRHSRRAGQGSIEGVGERGGRVDGAKGESAAQGDGIHRPSLDEWSTSHGSGEDISGAGKQRGRGKQGRETDKINKQFSAPMLAQARTIIRCLPEMAELVLEGVMPLNNEIVEKLLWHVRKTGD